MSISCYGAPFSATIVPGKIDPTVVGVWDVVVNDISVDSLNKSLITILDSLLVTYGVRTLIDVNPLTIKNSSIDDVRIDITYIGSEDVTDLEPALSPIGVITNNGKTISYCLGGMNVCEIQTYPHNQTAYIYQDGNEEIFATEGNRHVLGLNGRTFIDDRIFENDGETFGSLRDIVDNNEIPFDIIVNDVSLSRTRLINNQDEVLDITFTVDTTMPISNTNLISGTEEVMLSGKAVYCNRTTDFTSVSAGSPNNKIVDNNGISVKLAPKPIPSFNLILDTLPVLDTETETNVTLSGSANTLLSPNDDINDEYPDIDIEILIGDDAYYPATVRTGSNLTWSLSINNLLLSGKKCKVIGRRYGGVNWHHFKTIPFDFIT